MVMQNFIRASKKTFFPLAFCDTLISGVLHQKGIAAVSNAIQFKEFIYQVLHQNVISL